jgi:hypothetical protein
MPKFTSRTQTKDVAVFAASNGEGVRAEVTGGGAAIVGTCNSTGAGVFAVNNGDGAAGVFLSQEGRDHRDHKSD